MTRIKEMAVSALACLVCIVLFAGGLVVVAQIIDGNSRYAAERDRCLKNATNGYEIKQCR